MGDDVELRIGKLELKPGDVLVVKVDTILPYELIGRIKGHISENLPDDVHVLVIERGIDLAVLTRSEIEERAA